MSRRAGAIACLVAAVLLAWTGCSADHEPAASVRPSATAGGDTVSSDLAFLTADDKAAIGDFFSRWTAYTLALATGAEDFGEIYTGLARFGDTWEQHVEMAEGGTAVLTMELPSENGTVQLQVNAGRIEEGIVSYDSADSRVAASLAYMVACHGLIYSLAWEDDASGVQELYNECLRNFSERSDGLMRGDEVVLQDYMFEVSLNPDTQEMRFSASHTDQAAPSSSG